MFLTLLFLFSFCSYTSLAESVNNKQLNFSSFDTSISKKNFLMKKEVSTPFQSSSPKYFKNLPILLSQDNTNKTFDPFIDYGDFQDNITEEESLSFFQYGRSISILLTGGYEGITFNMRQIYGDSLLFVGLNISFFIDFHIAFQLSGTFPTGHYNSLFNTTWSFFHYGLDIKYYWHKQYLNEEQKFLNPYLIAGPFIFNVKSSLRNKRDGEIPILTTQQLSEAEQDLATQLEWDIGLKTGVGLEVNLLDPLFISFEVIHLYTNFPFHENKDLTMGNYPPLPESRGNQDIFYQLQYPNRPEVNGYKFYGDLFQIMAQIGINF